MYSLKRSTENSQKLLNFGKLKARFALVLKAKSSAWLAFSEKSSARLTLSKSSARFPKKKARTQHYKIPFLFLKGVRAILARSFSPVFKHNMIKTGLLPIQIDAETYKLLTGHESFEIKLDLEAETKQVQIVINNGDLVLHGEHLLLNSYDIKLFQSGGVIRHTLNGLLK